MSEGRAQEGSVRSNLNSHLALDTPPEEDSESERGLVREGPGSSSTPGKKL